MAHHQQNGQQYYRTDSSDSAACMMPPQGGKKQEEDPEKEGATKARKKCSPVWPATAVMAILALQIASTTGLFVYFTMSISKLKAQTQGTSEELKCLHFINSLEEMADSTETGLHELLLNEPCQRMASSIRSYVSMVTENVIHSSAQKDIRRNYVNSSEFQRPQGLSSKPSAHLTLRDHSSSNQGDSASGSHGFGSLPQSCRHPIRQWEDKNIWSHRQNISYHEGRLKITQPGKYYVYSQIYFRYPHRSENNSHAIGQQLVQCIHKKTSYLHPILLLKGVGTKCWAPNAEYGLHSVHQAGVFQLEVGDELFVSVSSLAMVDPEETASYFGTFKLDA